MARLRFFGRRADHNGLSHGRRMLYTSGFPNENFGLFTFMPELLSKWFRAFQQNTALQTVPDVLMKATPP